MKEKKPDVIVYIEHGTVYGVYVPKKQARPLNIAVLDFDSLDELTSMQKQSVLKEIEKTYQETDFDDMDVTI